MIKRDKEKERGKIENEERAIIFYCLFYFINNIIAIILLKFLLSTVVNHEVFKWVTGLKDKRKKRGLENTLW